MKKKTVVEDWDDIWTEYDELEDWEVMERVCHINDDFDDDPDMSNVDFEDEW